MAKHLVTPGQDVERFLWGPHRLVLADHKIWKPTPGQPINLEASVEFYLRRIYGDFPRTEIINIITVFLFPFLENCLVIWPGVALHIHGTSEIGVCSLRVFLGLGSYHEYHRTTSIDFVFSHLCHRLRLSLLFFPGRFQLFVFSER